MASKLDIYEKQKTLIKSKLSKTGIKFNNNLCIAGGTLRSIFTNEQIRDIDIWFKSKEDFIEFQNNNLKYYIPTFKSNNSITYNIKGNIVQLIKRNFGKPIDIINDFDFTICMCAYIPKDDKFILSKNFIKHVYSHTLYFNTKTTFNIETLLRLKKFMQKGYKIPTSEIIKISSYIENVKTKDAVNFANTYCHNIIGNIKKEKNYKSGRGNGTYKRIKRESNGNY